LEMSNSIHSKLFICQLFSLAFLTAERIDFQKMSSPLSKNFVTKYSTQYQLSVFYNKTSLI
jgi:hypothetical protein